MKSSLSTLLFLAVLPAVLVLSVVFGRFNSIYVCRECGAVAHETEWQIPFTPVTLFSSGKSIEPTPLSEMLNSLHLVPQQHAHQWWFAQGNGNGIMCALGAGRHAWQDAFNPSVPRLIQAANDFGDIDLRDRLVRRIFDRDAGSKIYFLSASTPVEGFSDASAFAAWRQEQSAKIEEALSVMPKSRRQ